MTKTFLKHRGRCGGGVVLDISRGFIISSPSMAISPDGITAGVLEINVRKSPGEGVEFLCSKCAHIVDPSDICCQCLVCKEYRPVSEMHVSLQILFACESCRSSMEGTNKNISDEMAKTISYLKAPRDVLQFVPMLEVLAKPLR